MTVNIAQSTSFVAVFKAYLASDHVTEATGKTIAITISKAGGAFGNPNAGATNATEITSGWYKVTLDTTDTNTLGVIAVRGAVATIDDVGIWYYVVSATTGGATNLDAAVSAIKTKTDFLPSATAGAAGGVFIAGTNAATVVTTSLTTTFTGNLTGSVASVTGAVGSVTGAVGSVTGAVGSVTGLTASNLDATISSRATPAQVNAEVVDGLNVDTYAEPAQGAPAATASLQTKLSYLYKAWRNKDTQTATTYSLYNDDAATVDHKATVSDDGTTFTRGEIATGP